MIHQVVRYISNIVENTNILVRKIKLISKYKGISLLNTKIHKNCDIRCVKGSKIIIRNSVISQGCQIIADNNSSIEINNAFIGPYSIIVAQKGIYINHCEIAEMVTIRDQNHNYGNKHKLITQQGFSSEVIYINNNVWIGAKASVLKGVTINENTVIAAHSVVNKSCDANCLYGGTPARLIKRF